MEQSRIKHLELIQAVIARLAGNSFTIKNIAVTVTTGVLAAAAALKEPRIIWLALIPLIMCWGLDTYYLRRERMFRALFDIERQQAGESDFNMRADVYKRSVSIRSTIRSPSIIWLYLPLIILVLFAWRVS